MLQQEKTVRHLTLTTKKEIIEIIFLQKHQTALAESLGWSVVPYTKDSIPSQGTHLEWGSHPQSMYGRQPIDISLSPEDQ